MRLLTLPKDWETFERDWPEAASFILGARLRYEHYQLLCRNHYEGNLYKWQSDRIKELSTNPAITEDEDYQRMLVAGGFK